MSAQIDAAGDCANSPDRVVNSLSTKEANVTIVTTTAPVSEALYA